MLLTHQLELTANLPVFAPGGPAWVSSTGSTAAIAIAVAWLRAQCHGPGEPADMPALARDAMVELPAPAPGRGLRGGVLAIAILLTAQA